MSVSLRALRRPPRLSRIDLLVVAAVLVVGCGGKVVLDDGDGGTTGAGAGAGAGGGLACDITNGMTHICEEVVGPPSGGASAFDAECMSGGGMPVSACTDTTRLGVCTVSAGGITLAVSFYAADGLTVASAQQACTADTGSWTPG